MPQVAGVERMQGHGEKLSRKQEQAIAALLACRTIGNAAGKAGIAERTLRTWLKLPAFLVAYRAARRELVEGAVSRMQAATGQAVDTLVAVAKDGPRPADRVRAAVAILDHAFRGLELADVLNGDAPADAPATIDGTADVVKLLAERLARLDNAELPTAEKARLTATLADSLLRAIGVDVIDKRLESLQAVLSHREKKP